MAGRYLAPSNPYQQFGTGCLKVYFPDDPFFFRALMGQIAELENRFIWDTGGDIDAANHIEQLWLAVGEQTRAGQLDGCPDCTAIQDQLDQCQQDLEEIENMEITVNCNCGSCSPTQPLPTLVNPTGQTIEVQCLYVDPNDPNDTSVPTWDDATQTPPTGYPDWQTFVDNRCLLANYMVDAFLETAEKLDDAENRASVLVDIVSIALLFIPIPVGKTKGALTVLKWVTKLAAFLQLVEQPLDYLQWIQDIVDENKQDMVCTIYNAQDAATMVTAFQTILQDGLDLIPGYTNLAQDAQDAFSDWLLTLAADITPLAQNYAVSTFVPADYSPTFDCAICDNPAPSGFAYVAVQNITVPSYRINSGGSNPSHVLNPDNSIDFQFDASGANGSVDINLQFDVPVPHGTLKYVGFRFDLEEISNVRDDSGRILQSTEATGVNIWDGTVTNGLMQPQHLVRENSGGNTTQYPSVITGEQVRIGVSTNVNSCTPTQNKIRIGCHSAAAGTVQLKIKNMYWIRGLETVC